MTFVQSGTTPNIAFEHFRTNSPYNPDSISTRNALGFSTYGNLYNKYRVLNSHIEVTPISNQDKGILLVQKNPIVIVNQFLSDALEKKYTTWALPSQLRNGGKRSVTSYWSMKENPELSVEDFTDINSAPAEDVYFKVGYGSYQNDAITCMVNITYDVEFSDRKMVT
jgi:hypothetical protein